jgi:hypothetical protein
MRGHSLKCKEKNKTVVFFFGYGGIENLMLIEF